MHFSGARREQPTLASYANHLAGGTGQVDVEGSVQNKGWILENVDHKDTSQPEEIRIRGFKINKIEQLEGSFHEPGKYCLKP